MNIKFLVFKQEGEVDNKKLLDDISSLRNENYIFSYQVLNRPENDLFYLVKDQVENKEEVDYYFLLINNTMFFNNELPKILQEYFDKESEVFLPLVFLNDSSSNSGLLNASIWNVSNMNVGELDHIFCLQQTDNTLFGALIHKELLFEESNYDKSIQYFQHFYFLNKITYDKKPVSGIPKVLFSLEDDLSLPGIDNKIKVEDFKKSYEYFANQLEKQHIN